MILLEQGDREGAQHAFLEALQENPESFCALKNLMLLYRSMGSVEEAEALTRRIEEVRRREEAAMEHFLDRANDTTTGGPK